MFLWISDLPTSDLGPTYLGPRTSDLGLKRLSGVGMSASRKSRIQKNHFSIIKHSVLSIPGELSEFYRIELELGSEPEPELGVELEQN